ncbi:MAG: polyprenyl synthetase family protein [Bacillota bacterium]
MREVLGQACSIVGREMVSVERTIEALLAPAGQQLSAAIEQAIGAEGKRLRPALVLLSGRLFSFRRSRLVSIAAAMELVHMASLVHDDVIDRAETRRGRASVQQRFGNQVAVLLGDYFLAKALELVAPMGPNVVGAIAGVVNDLVEGEFAQRRMNGSRVSEEAYLASIEYKTARFLATCCRLGARVGGAAQELCALLGEYGRHLGLAFQIRDDVLDLVGSEAHQGKPVGSDLRQGIITLPVIHGMRQERVAEHLRELLAAEKLDIEGVRHLLVGAGSIDYALKLAEDHIRQAKELLTGIPASVPREALSAIADFSIRRVS